MALGGGGGGSSGAIRAGRAFVELFTDDAKLRAGLAKAKAQVAHFGKGMREIGSTIGKGIESIGSAFKTVGKAAIGAGVLLAAPLIGSIKHFTEFGSQLIRMAERTGFTVETLGALAYAASQAGVSLEDVEGAIKKMQKNLTSADEDAQSAQQTLLNLGLTIEQLSGRSVEQQFLMISTALEKVKDDTHRAGLAMQIFGRNGTALEPLLRNLGPKMREAFELGLVPSKEQAEKAHELEQSFSRLWSVVKSGAFSIGSGLSEMLLDWAGKIQGVLVQVRNFITENPQLITLLAGIAGSLIVGGIALYVFGTAITTVVSILSGFFGIIAGGFIILGGLASMIGFLFTPVGILTAAITALGVAFAQTWLKSGAGKDIFGGIGEGLMAFAGRIKEVFLAINEGMRAGDWGRAMKIAMLAVEVEWKRFKNNMLNGWEDLKTSLGTSWREFWAGLLMSLADFFGKAQFEMWLFKQKIKNGITIDLGPSKFQQMVKEEFEKRFPNERFEDSDVFKRNLLPQDRLKLPNAALDEIDRRGAKALEIGKEAGRKYVAEERAAWHAAKEAAEADMEKGILHFPPLRESEEARARKRAEIELKAEKDYLKPLSLKEFLAVPAKDQLQTNFERLSKADQEAALARLRRQIELEKKESDLKAQMDQALAEGRMAKIRALGLKGFEEADREAAQFRAEIAAEAAANAGKAMERYPEFSKGIFQAPNYAQVFGTADTIPKRMLDQTEKIQQNTKDLNDKLDKVPLARFVA